MERFTLKHSLITIICCLYLLLFVYAALSKLLDYSHFEIQLGKSPVIGSFAAYLAWMVPVVELVLAVLLCFERTRFIGLFGAFHLMVLFSVYILVILNWSSFIPCSCGGILSEMGWTEHLVFNLIFVFIGGLGLYFQWGISAQEVAADPKALTAHRKRFFYLIAGSLVCSTLAMLGLFLLSEHESHRNNGFIRTYPHSPVTTKRGWELPYNSYYIAGITKDTVFLGNLVAPSHLLRVVLDRMELETVDVSLLQSGSIPFTAPKIEVRPPYFYVYDGNVPVVFRGLTSEWQGALYWKGRDPFLQFQTVAADTLLVSGLHQNQSTIGLLGSGTPAFPVLPSLLKKQTSDVFDTDGMLHYNEDLRQLVYVYYYRNKFVVSNLSQTDYYEGKTIDTLAQPQLKIAYDDAGRTRSFAEPPTFVQLQACTSGRYLFIKSNRLGRYESSEMLDDASIIDVYDLEQQTYAFSFYLYDYEGEKVKSFRVQGDKLIGLTDRHLVVYQLQEPRFDLSPVEKER